MNPMNHLPEHVILAGLDWIGFVVILAAALIHFISRVAAKNRQGRAKQQQQKKSQEAAPSWGQPPASQAPAHAPRTELEELLEALGRAAGAGPAQQAKPPVIPVTPARERAQKIEKAEEEEFHVSEVRPHSIFTHSAPIKPATTDSTVGTTPITRLEPQYAAYEPSEMQEVDFVQPKPQAQSQTWSHVKQAASPVETGFPTIRLDTLLSSTFNLRQAILVREILGPPVAFRA